MRRKRGGMCDRGPRQPRFPITSWVARRCGRQRVPARVQCRRGAAPVGSPQWAPARHISRRTRIRCRLSLPVQADRTSNWVAGAEHGSVACPVARVGEGRSLDGGKAPVVAGRVQGEEEHSERE